MLKMIIGDEVEGDFDPDCVMENCCKVIGRKMPESFALVDLADEND